jgi:hypothetical protein
MTPYEHNASPLSQGLVLHSTDNKYFGKEDYQHNHGGIIVTPRMGPPSPDKAIEVDNISSSFSAKRYGVRKNQEVTGKIGSMSPPSNRKTINT